MGFSPRSLAPPRKGQGGHRSSPTATPSPTPHIHASLIAHVGRLPPMASYFSSSFLPTPHRTRPVRSTRPTSVRLTSSQSILHPSSIISQPAASHRHPPGGLPINPPTVPYPRSYMLHVLIVTAATLHLYPVLMVCTQCFQVSLMAPR